MPTELINDKAVYTTAPATPGLLKSLEFTCFEEHMLEFPLPSFKQLGLGAFQIYGRASNEEYVYLKTKLFIEITYTQGYRCTGTFNNNTISDKSRMCDRGSQIETHFRNKMHKGNLKTKALQNSII